jgi:hypothetical protein
MPELPPAAAEPQISAVVARARAKGAFFMMSLLMDVPHPQLAICLISRISDGVVSRNGHNAVKPLLID